MEDTLLTIHSPEVQYLCRRDKRLAKLIAMVGDIRVNSHKENTFSFLVHEIIEQMLSVKAGQRIFNRLEDLCNGEVTPERISMLSDEQIRLTGSDIKLVL
ncbi:hypothetical protein [Hominenteromicrobium sp.]|uniref:hypothetical protein n=1 Tax=Hominenteromicrobium sp. TaxID=3073581 RepID=UPI003A8EC87C